MTNDAGNRRGELPAVVQSGSIEQWYLHGKLHRTDGPAATSFETGREEWWYEGYPHRDGGPAVTEPGTEEWWHQGELHRDDGPAVSRMGGRVQLWYRHGKLHRTDGPAVNLYGLTVEHWIDGKPVEDSGYEYEVDPYGTRTWRRGGRLHRDDDHPALLAANNDTAIWYRSGLKHRDHGPAVFTMSGVEWWVNGKQRDSRAIPTRFTSDHVELWAISGVPERTEGYLHRTDGPALVVNGDQYWYFNGWLHRVIHPWDNEERIITSMELEPFWGITDEEDAAAESNHPTVILADGTRKWYDYGRLHRWDGGPAVIYLDGREEYWHMGARK
jgi:hypothetical protein